PVAKEFLLEAFIKDTSLSRALKKRHDRRPVEAVHSATSPAVRRGEDAAVLGSAVHFIWKARIGCNGENSALQRSRKIVSFPCCPVVAAYKQRAFGSVEIVAGTEEECLRSSGRVGNRSAVGSLFSQREARAVSASALLDPHS